MFSKVVLLIYLGEGDIGKDRIVEEISKNNKVVFGSKQDDYYGLLIKNALDLMNRRMHWRGLFNKSTDPLISILTNKTKDFYSAFDDLKKGRIDIVVAGNRYEHPFIVYINEENYVAGVAAKYSLYLGYGLLEAWCADPRIYTVDGQGYKAFNVFFPATIAYLLTLYIGLDRTYARNVLKVFDKDLLTLNNINEYVKLSKNNKWVGGEEIQRKAKIALRGYLNAWFQFMESSSWLEIHHTLMDTKVVEKEQSFLDTATTEISENAREIMLDDSIKSIFSAEEMERRERERREKQLDWTLLRIALGILYVREKEYLRSLWEKEKRSVSWKWIEENYYEEIWDMIRKHLAGEDVMKVMEDKDKRSLGKWHFIFESKKSERPKEKEKELKDLSLQELMERKNRLLQMLEWEGKGLPLDATWNDVITRFRKIMIRYHPDRIEITGIDKNVAKEVTARAIEVFRELEIIHDIEPSIFGMAKLPEDYLENKN